MARSLSIALVAAALVAACSPPPAPPAAAQPHPVVTYSKDTDFEGARDFLVLAIQNRGLVVDHTSYIGNMLERTGKDLGMTTQVFVNAEAFSFCSATASRKTMEADPHNIAFCPYVLSIYVTPQEPKKVYVSYRRPWRPDGSDASKASLKAVEDLLDGIAREALGIAAK